ncbi:MAG TPA: carboxypeptidase regulatory-like domain-containing protein [Gemmatimonadaceae bacterium]|jgi:hypothetical protein
MTASLVLAALLSSELTAQSAIVATVRDSAGAGIAGAELLVQGSAAHGFTDDDGQLRLTDVPPGPAHVTIRRLGFRLTTMDVTIAADAPTKVMVRLTQVAQRLDPILVRGSAHAYGDRMEGFYNRRNHGSGYFITRTDIEREQPDRLTDMFRRIPGIQINATRLIPDAVRMRGETACAPLVWIDGMAAASAEFDLDAIVPESVEAIEVYNGLSEVPVQFMPPMDLKACGVVVVWSRRGGPNEKTPKDVVSPGELADLVAALKVYTAADVDTPAHQDTSVRVVPTYPESFFLAGKGGTVAAEFVVDTTGAVAIGTFNAISSTDPAFTVAVRRALANALYVPAVLAGHRVRQVVHQPFTFVVDREKKTGPV